MKLKLNQKRVEERGVDWEYFKHKIEAQQKCYEVANKMWREDCAEKIRTSPPEQLQPNIILGFTGNLLRFAERNIGFGAQTNVWG